jgi:hypothetical protein
VFYACRNLFLLVVIFKIEAWLLSSFSSDAVYISSFPFLISFQSIFTGVVDFGLDIVAFCL